MLEINIIEDENYIILDVDGYYDLNGCDLSALYRPHKSATY